MIFAMVIEKELVNLNQNKMKQTAVEWLAEEIMANPFRIENDRLWDKAKEMEKQQIIDAVIWFDNTERTPSQIDIIVQQYYNETFKNTKE